MITAIIGAKVHDPGILELERNFVKYFVSTIYWSKLASSFILKKATFQWLQETLEINFYHILFTFLILFGMRNIFIILPT